MDLYRLEVQTDQGKLVVISAAEDETKAFEAVDEHIERHFLSAPVIHEVTLLEKKRITSGASFIIDM